MSIINLLPDDYVQRRLRRRTNVICLGLFALVMVGVLGAAAASELSVRHSRAVLERVNTDYLDAARLIEQFQSLQSQEAALCKRAELTASLIERVPRSTLLAIVTQALPEHSSVMKLDLQVKQVVTRASTARTRATAGEKKPPPVAGVMVLEVTGLAGTDVEVARFIATLARNPMIESVDLVYSQEKEFDKKAVREFQITALVKDDADAIELAKPAQTAGAEAPARTRDGRPL